MVNPQAKPGNEAGLALVVAKDKNVSQLVSALLDAEGYETRQCPDAVELASCVVDESPAVIVVDAAIALGNPLDLCKSIRQSPGCDYVPLLLLADECDEASEERAYEQNVTTVIAKPVDEAAFTKHIHSLGDTGRTLSGIRALRMPESDVLRSMPMRSLSRARMACCVNTWAVRMMTASWRPRLSRAKGSLISGRRMSRNRCYEVSSGC